MSAYITATGRFLPGNPVSSEELEDYLGTANGISSDLRDLTLINCGVKTRHYAIDKNQRTIISNAAMAANAVREAVGRAGLGPNDVELLTAATTGPDMLAPGHASLVHAELGYGPMEISTSAGICSSGMMALKNPTCRWRSVRSATRLASPASCPPHFQEHPVRRDGSARRRRIAASGVRLPALHALRRRGRRGHRNPRRIGNQPSHRLDFAEVLRKHPEDMHVRRQRLQYGHEGLDGLSDRRSS